jgi:hypothetical protein
MTAAQPQSSSDPPPPVRGLTREERGRDVSGLFHVTVYPVLWLIFWPVRAHQTKRHPEEYAANRAKYAKKK